MEHVVFYPGADGNSAFARFTSMDDAVAFVERLRNVEGVTDAALFGLVPVPMVVKTYFRVEVPPVDESAALEPVVAAEAAPVKAEPAVEEPAAVVEAPVVEALAEVEVAHAPVSEPEPAVADVVEPVAEPIADVPMQSTGDHVDEPVVEAEPEAQPDVGADAEEMPMPVAVGTPDIIAPAHSGRRSLGFFNH